MSVLLGCFAFDMCDMREHADAVRNGLGMLAEDEAAVICEPGIAMGVGTSRVWSGTPAAPLRSPSERLIAFDGRIDNRDDLAMLLYGDLHARSDEEIALGAFDRWGMDGLGRLVGEWSAAIWDAPRRMLHLARDYVGARPLYYATGPTWVMWSTHLGELALRAGVADALSETFVALTIARHKSPDLTPYTAVRAVSPGSCLSWHVSGATTRRRFWSIGSNTIRLRGDGDYEEALRALWSDAVRVRLRTTQPVWAELSGGLDSSAVVCMADALMAAGRADTGSLHLISHATLESPEGDERRFIAEIEQRTGLRSEVVGLEQYRSLIDEHWEWATPSATRRVLLACLRHIRSRGGRLILSGRMGDTVMGCQPDNSVAALDDLADGGVLRAIAGIRTWSRALQQPFWLTTLRLLRWLANPRADDRDDGAARPTGSLLTERLQMLAADHRTPVSSLRHVRPAQRRLARSILDYAGTSRLDLPVQPPGITYAYPFAHRPLVEFVMAIPAGVLSAPGDTRTLMRRAFAGLVPPRVLGRQSKGFYSPVALRGLRSTAARFLPVDRLEIVERGWIDPVALDAALRTLIDTGTASHELRRTLRLEEWLASRLRRGPAAIPERKEVTSNGVQHA